MTNENPVDRIQIERHDVVNRTDVGNSRRLANRFGEVIRYVPQHKAWYLWDGTRWKLDERGVIFELAKETALCIAEEAHDAETEEERTKILSWAAQSQTAIPHRSDGRSRSY